jgi:hypothetical protein
MKALTEKFVCCAIFSNMLACVQGDQACVRAIFCKSLIIVTFCRQSNSKLFWRDCPAATGLHVLHLTQFQVGNPSAHTAIACAFLSLFLFLAAAAAFNFAAAYTLNARSRVFLRIPFDVAFCNTFIQIVHCNKSRNVHIR